MHHIKKAALHDFERIHAFIDQIDEDWRTINDENIITLLDRGCVYLLLEETNILGCGICCHSMRDLFFPLSHSFSKENEILDSMQYHGEPICSFAYFRLSPFCAYEKEGKEFLLDLMAQNKGSSFFAAVKETDLDMMSLLLKIGYTNHGIDSSLELASPCYLLIKPYKPLGLCRELKW